MQANSELNGLDMENTGLSFFFFSLEKSWDALNLTHDSPMRALKTPIIDMAG